MALSLRKPRKATREFRFSHDPYVMSEDFFPHSRVVQVCRTDNEVARHTGKPFDNRSAFMETRIFASAVTSKIEGLGNCQVDLSTGEAAFAVELAVDTNTDIKTVEKAGYQVG